MIIRFRLTNIKTKPKNFKIGLKRNIIINFKADCYELTALSNLIHSTHIYLNESYDYEKDNKDRQK